MNSPICTIAKEFKEKYKVFRGRNANEDEISSLGKGYGRLSYEETGIKLLQPVVHALMSIEPNK